MPASLAGWPTRRKPLYSAVMFVKMAANYGGQGAVGCVTQLGRARHVAADILRNLPSRKVWQF